MMDRERSGSTKVLLLVQGWHSLSPALKRRFWMQRRSTVGCLYRMRH